MRIRIAIWLFISAVSSGGQTPPTQAKKLLFIGESKGYRHSSVPHAMEVIEKLGKQSGAWETVTRLDTELITRENLKRFDAVLFYTTGELEMNDDQKAALLGFLKDDGKGFLGTHSATDTFYAWPAYGDLIGAYFDGHPWNQVHVEIRVEDREFPATRQFASHFSIYDEIYQFKAPYSRDGVHVLMSVDPNSVDLTRKEVHRTDRDFAITWIRPYGKGRVFYSALGHREEVWDRPDIQQMWKGAIEWATGASK